MMNFDQLDALLHKKSQQKSEFTRSSAEFTTAFFARINGKKKYYTANIILKFAAVFLIATALWLYYFISRPVSEKDQFVKLRESMRIFDSSVSVLFFDDTLVTGTRESEDSIKNKIHLAVDSGSKQLDLIFAASDNDSIYLDGEKISGNLIISRSDSQTIVLDIDLHINGVTVRETVPLTRNAKGNYSV